MDIDSIPLVPRQNAVVITFLDHEGSPRAIVSVECLDAENAPFLMQRAKKILALLEANPEIVSA